MLLLRYVNKKTACETGSFLWNFRQNYLSDFTTALNASGWFIARSASAFLFNSIPCALIFPMNSE